MPEPLTPLATHATPQASAGGFRNGGMRLVGSVERFVGVQETHTAAGATLQKMLGS